MKRLYVRPAFRGHDIGRNWQRDHRRGGCDWIFANEAGYDSGKMDRAIEMYRELGFVETAPYYDTPVGHTVFMELALSSYAETRASG